MKFHFNLAHLVLVCSLLATPALALEQRAGLVAGFPEQVDLSYGISGPYGGIEVATGIVALAVTEIKGDDMFTMVWNPSLGVSKKFSLTPWLYLKPKLSTMYYAGYGYEKATDGFNYLRLRFDKLYFMEGIGLGFDYKSWFLELNPALLQYRGFTIEMDNAGHLPVSERDKSGTGPFGFSLSIGKFF